MEQQAEPSKQLLIDEGYTVNYVKVAGDEMKLSYSDNKMTFIQRIYRDPEAKGYLIVITGGWLKDRKDADGADVLQTINQTSVRVVQ